MQFGQKKLPEPIWDSFALEPQIIIDGSLFCFCSREAYNSDHCLAPPRQEGSPNSNWSVTRLRMERVEQKAGSRVSVVSFQSSGVSFLISVF